MRTMIARFVAGCFTECSAALRTLGRAVGDFSPARGTDHDEDRAALGADQIIGLQGGAASWAALATAMRAHIGLARHGFAAVRTLFGIVVFKR